MWGNMPSPKPKLLNNQDLIRASAKSISPEAIAQALLWVRGEAPFPYPTSIHLDLTLRCTAHCIHCRQWTWPKHSEFSIEQLERLFSIFQTWGLHTVTFGGGNPLLHEHFCAALRIAHDNNIKFGIISEGIDMSDEMADEICKYANWMRFSLDGSTPDIHDFIRNTPGLFNKVVQSILKLQSRNSSLSLGINCIVQKNNLHCLSELIDLGSQLNLDAVLFKVPHGKDPLGHYLPTEEEWKNFVEWVHQAKDSNVGRSKTNLLQLSNLLDCVFQEEDVIKGKPVKTFYKNDLVHCFAPLFFLTCDSEGNMYPCDYLQADTRAWKGKYGRMRNEFCLGNLLEDHEKVLKKLDMMLRHRIHELPANGYEECGCCTRFCQLNAALTHLEQQLQNSEITNSIITGVLGSKPSEYPFL